MDIHCQETTSEKVRFVREASAREHREIIDVAVTERDWDVTDLEARHAAAVLEVGEFGEGYHTKNVTWYIDPKRNAAALLVHRVPGSASAALVCG